MNRERSIAYGTETFVNPLVGRHALDDGRSQAECRIVEGVGNDKFKSLTLLLNRTGVNDLRSPGSPFLSRMMFAPPTQLAIMLIAFICSPSVNS